MTKLPASYNPYNYVFNNPILLTDPSGEFPHVIAAGLLGGVIGLIGGGIFGSLTYDWALSRKCGCDKQQWALNTDRSNYVYTVAIWGGAIGGIAAAAASTGPVPPLVS